MKSSDLRAGFTQDSDLRSICCKQKSAARVYERDDYEAVPQSGLHSAIDGASLPAPSVPPRSASLPCQSETDRE